MTLVQACLKHLGEQQMKILRAMVSRQSYTLSMWDRKNSIEKVFMEGVKENEQNVQ